MSTSVSREKILKWLVEHGGDDYQLHSGNLSPFYYRPLFKGAKTSCQWEDFWREESGLT